MIVLIVQRCPLSTKAQVDNAVIRMMQTHKLLGLTLIAIFVSSMILPVSLSLSLSAYAANDEKKAGQFIDIAQKAYEHTWELRERARERGINVTAADDLIGQGDAKLTEARDALVAGDYAKAIQDAKEAQLMFRNALGSLDGLAELAEAEEDEGGRAKGLLVAIEQTEDRIQRIADVINGITPTPENQQYIDEVNGNLTEAQQNIADARAELEKEEPDITAAADLHSEANKNVEEALKALKSIGDWTVSWRAESFLNGIKNKLENVNDQLDRAEDRGIDVSALRERLTDVDDLIDSARTKLLDGDKKGAIGDVKDARNTSQDIIKDLHELQKPGK